MVKSKIICTLGPASSNRTVLRKMMLAGLDVVRLNFSHGTLERHLNSIHLVRKLNKKYRRHMKILGDLEGYRIRIARLEKGKPVELKKRQTIWLTQEDISGKRDLIPFDYRGPLTDIKNGQYIYIEFSIENRLDYIAQSFVRTKDDILKIKEMLKNGQSECKVIAKIENREGIRNIDEIIDVSDG